MNQKKNPPYVPVADSSSESSTLESPSHQHASHSNNDEEVEEEGKKERRISQDLLPELRSERAESVAKRRQRPVVVTSTEHEKGM